MHGPADKAAQDKKILANLSRIKYTVMVMSGKGGVGKSTVSVNLAATLAREGYSVGIMDVDVHGPNIPKMLGIESKQFGGISDALEPVEVHGIKIASLALAGYHPDEAIIWRGPVKIAMIRQFLADVAWGDLDYLIIDTPPGTGDEVLTLAQDIPDLSGAVVVTTPQDVSVLDSRKSITFAKKLGVQVLGIIENMSGFVCPCCQTVSHIFKSGGGIKIAESFGVPFIGEIPIESAMVISGDSGIPHVMKSPESLSAKALSSICVNMCNNIRINEQSGINKPKKDAKGFKPER